MDLRPASYFVLASLLDGPLHGYAISARARELSDGDVRLTAGTLYGALDRIPSPAARASPPPRRSDAQIVRDCARDSIDADGVRVLMRELVSLVATGLRVRLGLATRDLWRAPWRD